jgi:hypothetical protein
MQDFRNEHDYEGYIGVSHAPANFPDADGNDVKMMAPNTLGNVVSNVSLYHVSSDITDKQQAGKIWRKKVREIINAHQERIIDFFTKPVPKEHPLHMAHTLLTKYSKHNQFLTMNETNKQTFKDYVVDISGQGIDELNTYISELEKTRVSDTPLQRWSFMIKSLLDYMKVVGDEMIRIDQKLQNQCFHLDIVVEKVLQLISLERPEIEGFEEVMQKYIEQQFESHPIEKLYMSYIYAIQKYSALRDILTSHRIMNASEPLCCVCMAEPIIMVFIPCGHTFCTNCSKKTAVCHVCRQGITSRVKIYIG